MIKNKYGITKEQYDDILESQDFKCAICGEESSVDRRNLDIDHDHTTGKIRGLLCSRCNKGIGMFEDNFILLENAIAYLKHVTDPVTLESIAGELTLLAAVAAPKPQTQTAITGEVL